MGDIVITQLALPDLHGEANYFYVKYQLNKRELDFLSLITFLTEIYLIFFSKKYLLNFFSLDFRSKIIWLLNLNESNAIKLNILALRSFFLFSLVEPTLHICLRFYAILNNLLILFMRNFADKIIPTVNFYEFHFNKENVVFKFKIYHFLYMTYYFIYENNLGYYLLKFGGVIISFLLILIYLFKVKKFNLVKYEKPLL